MCECGNYLTDHDLQGKCKCGHCLDIHTDWGRCTAVWYIHVGGLRVGKSDKLQLEKCSCIRPKDD